MIQARGLLPYLRLHFARELQLPLCLRHLRLLPPLLAGLLLFRDGTRLQLERMTKREMADRILDVVVPRLT